MTVEGLKDLKAPEEQGSKKSYDTFLEKFVTEILVKWTYGTDIGYVIENREETNIQGPVESPNLLIASFELLITTYHHKQNLLPTMVLTANQHTAFFEDAAQMNIPHATRLQPSARERRDYFCRRLVPRKVGFFWDRARKTTVHELKIPNSLRTSGKKYGKSHGNLGTCSS